MTEFANSKRMTKRWYVAQTQPRRENAAFVHLERQGFVAFLPTVKRLHKSSGKGAFVKTPLFPGYIFVAFDYQRERWRSINGTIGISRLVSFGEQPAPLPTGFVKALLARTNDGADSLREARLPDGAPVRIVGGVFDDLTGILLTSKPRERVVVLLDLLSGPRRVTLTRGQLVDA